jgi:hypothetical protein
MPFTTTSYDPLTGRTTAQQTDSAGGNVTQTQQVAQTPVATPLLAQPTMPVTASSISPATPTNITQPNNVPVPDVSSLQSQIDTINAQQATPEEQNISATQKRINDLSGFTAQEEARKAALLADPALQAKRQSVQDLTTQLNSLIAESKAIPVRIQQDALGRGVTAGGMAPIQAAQLRNNAIQSLSVGSLLSASQGNLTLALDQVDRSIQAEFGPKKAELAALQANLDNMLKDPNLSLGQKKRAEIAQARLDAEKTKVAQQEQDKQATKDAVISAVSKNTGNPKLTSIAMGALNKATSAAEVAQIVQQLGLSTMTEEQRLSQSNADRAFNQSAYQFGVQQDAKNAASATSNAPVTPEQAQKSKDQLDLVMKTLDKADALSGRSGSDTMWEKLKQNVGGQTEFTNLVALTNTLRTNVLTMQTDPAIKKFFGPQMSNADVQLMTAAGTTLNPSLQSPEALKEEIGRIKDLVQRAKDAVATGESGSSQSGSQLSSDYNSYLRAIGQLQP